MTSIEQTVEKALTSLHTLEPRPLTCIHISSERLSRLYSKRREVIAPQILVQGKE